MNSVVIRDIARFQHVLIDQLSQRLLELLDVGQVAERFSLQIVARDLFSVLRSIQRDLF